MEKRFSEKKVDRDWLNTNFPCMMACPAHTNAGRYVSLIAEGRFAEAYQVARDPNPMASICGRVCAHAFFFGGDEDADEGQSGRGDDDE